jgi:hypothetical protein
MGRGDFRRRSSEDCSGDDVPLSQGDGTRKRELGAPVDREMAGGP